MLPKLDEYAPVRLEHLEGPQGTPLMAGLEDVVLLDGVVERIALVECGSVAAVVSVCVLPLARMCIGVPTR